MKKTKGESAMNRFIDAEEEMRRVLKFPEIFHWLGLFSLSYLERNKRKGNAKEEEEQKR